MQQVLKIPSEHLALLLEVFVCRHNRKTGELLGWERCGLSPLTYPWHASSSPFSTLTIRTWGPTTSLYPKIGRKRNGVRRPIDCCWLNESPTSRLGLLTCEKMKARDSEPSVSLFSHHLALPLSHASLHTIHNLLVHSFCYSKPPSTQDSSWELWGCSWNPSSWLIWESERVVNVGNLRMVKELH